MGWPSELTISNRIFLALNILAIIVGIGLMILSGPTGPLVLLVVGAVGPGAEEAAPISSGRERPARLTRPGC